jgi:energy-converting hydrogenase A subunit M
MAKIESILAEVGELLAVLAVKLDSASIEEMPALIEDAKQMTRLVITRCLASDVVSELPPKEAAMLRTELVRLGEALQTQIAGLVEVRLEQLTGDSASLTRH